MLNRIETPLLSSLYHTEDEDMEEATKNAIVIIRLSAENAKPARIRESAPLIKQIIEKYSDKEYQLAFTSPDGSTFGWLLNTSQSLGKLRAALHGETSETSSSPLLSDDCCICLELGSDWAGYGFSQAWTWLQHHKI